MNTISFFSSWSGGKDSALAFYLAAQNGWEPKFLLTMFEEGGQQSKSHALPYEVIAAQARNMGVPLVIQSASWETYERQFKEALNEMKRSGITHGVFGDIDLIDHLEWVRNVCQSAGLIAEHPLWNWPRETVLMEFIDSGFEAYIIVVDTTRMSKEFLGKKITHELVRELKRSGIDPCGESGEFHTIVVNGPIFSAPVSIKFEEIVEHEQYAFLKLVLG